MDDAVDETENIRQWEDHMWDLTKLQQVYSTDIKEGLTTH